MPRINGLINGSSRAYGFKSVSVSLITYDTLNFIASGNLTVTNNGTSNVNIFKTSGSFSWDNHAYIATPYTAPCTLEFYKLADAGDNGLSYAMMSWNADPTANASYDTLDYASYPYATNGYYIYHNGSGINPGISWNTANKFYIVYSTDGFMRHYNGSTLLYSVFYGIGNTVYVDSSFYSVNGTYGGFSDIRVIKSAWTGTNYPNVSAPPGLTSSNPLASPVAARTFGLAAGSYYFRSGSMSTAELLEYQPNYYENKPFCCVFRSSFGGAATTNKIDLNIPMAGLLVQRDALDLRGAVYWSSPITYTTVGGAGNNTADSGSGYAGSNARRVMLGGGGGHGIYNSSQQQCNWGNSSGSIGAGYNGSCGTFPNSLIWGTGTGSPFYDNNSGTWSHWITWG